jgi:hypothetical protein
MEHVRACNGLLQVARVEDYGVFIEFTHAGRTTTALMERDEAKVPAARLSDKQKASFTDAGEDVPDYADVDFDNISSVYSVGE